MKVYFFCGSSAFGGGMGLNSWGFRGSDPSPTWFPRQKSFEISEDTSSLEFAVTRIRYSTGMPELAGEARIRHASFLRHISTSVYPCGEDNQQPGIN